jgi:hypothetical protein
VRCPYCGYPLFHSRLVWEVCTPERAILTIRCPRRTNYKVHPRCKRIVYLTLTGNVTVRFNDSRAISAIFEHVLNATKDG